MVSSLYIHIPFCIKKCLYCDFYSIPFKSDTANYYVSALCKEIELQKKLTGELKTIYIGGGTPTMLPIDLISKILHTVKRLLGIGSDAEITIEANPRSITKEKAEGLLRLSINRISIGVQSFNDRELETLGRSYSANDSIKSVVDVKESGFKNVSIDLIYGIPGQSLEAWEYSLSRAIELSPEHISAYELTPEKNTPLYEDIQKGRIIMPNEDLIAEMYYRCVDKLIESGYIHYEISNFAKHGYECKHNLNYWNMGEYLGIGVGAHSFFDRKRISNVKDLFYYIESIKNNRIPVADEVETKGDETIKEFIFLGLRKTKGIDIRHLPNDKMSIVINAVKDLNGLVELKDDYLRFTKKGLLLSNEVIAKILLHIE